MWAKRAVYLLPRDVEKKNLNECKWYLFLELALKGVFTYLSVKISKLRAFLKIIPPTRASYWAAGHRRRWRQNDVIALLNTMSVALISGNGHNIMRKLFTALHLVSAPWLTLIFRKSCFDLRLTKIDLTSFWNDR